MHLNSNDLFEQIGLVVDPPDSRAQRSINYSVYLQIELSEGKHELLQIKNYDNPHGIASAFCRKHKLNHLAVQIVENKIIEAKRREETRLRQSQSPQQRQSFRDSNERQDRSGKKERIDKRAKEAQSKSISRSKSRANHCNHKKQKQISPSKQQTRRKSTLKSTNNQFYNIHKDKKPNPDIGNQLYSRAMVKLKMHENQRVKEHQMRLKEQQRELTFQPKINPVSAKIVEFRRENPDNTQRQKQKQNKKDVINNLKKTAEDEELRQCTFKPQINKVSEIISQNSQTYKDQYDHFNALYNQAKYKKDRIHAEIEKSQVQLFQPKINPKSSQTVKDTFQQRLAKSLLKKKQRQNQLNKSQYDFKPKIGRGPKDSRFNRQTQSSVSLWDHLYSQKLKKCPTSNVFQEVNIPPKSSASSFYYENLIDKRISEVFTALDGDEDGEISPQNIAIEKLTKNELLFLKPVFQEMDQLQAILDYNQFKNAVMILLQQFDPSAKGSFLSEKRKAEEKSSFTPLINNKSKQIAYSRANSTNCVYDQLYEQGLKELQKKEYKIQLEKARQQQKQLQGCSFKPQLNNTSKYYIEKVLGKKINEKFEDDPKYR